MKIERLLFISRTCPPLAERALELAIKELKESTKNVPSYQNAVNELNQLNPSNLSAIIDNDWVTQVNGENNQTHESLEKSLRQASSTVVESAIADAFSALTEYYINTGNYSAAVRNSHRESDYRSGVSDNYDITRLSWLNLISGNMGQARSLPSKKLAIIDNAGSTTLDGEEVVKLQMIHALGYYHGGDFEDTAATILKMDSKPNDPTVATASDMAIICALCAMASFDRESLRFLAYKDSAFASLAEEVPYTREMVLAFVTSDYRKLFDLWRTYENDFRLDIYISRQLESIYKLIRSRAMTQYLSVYSELPVSSIVETFGENNRAILLELKKLIEEQQLDIKIDCKRNRIVLNSGVGFDDVYEKTLALAQKYRRDTRVLMWSAEVLKFADADTK